MNTKITIENIQDKIAFTNKHKKLIKKVVKATLKEQNFKIKSIISVTVTDNENIRAINKEHRNIDSSTDVLSFPLAEFENGEIVFASGDYFKGKLILGDIVLSFEKALEQSEEFGHSFEREIGFLVCHSMLHLVGYDHENDFERSIMRKHEENVMNILKLTR